MFGFSEEDIAEEFALYEVVADSFALFLQISRQWRAGPAGPIGIDMGVLPMMFDVWEVTDKDEKREILQNIAIIESAALAQMAENQAS